MISAASDNGRRRRMRGAFARGAALWAAIVTPLASAAAADVDDSFLRGSYEGLSGKDYARWDGINFGGHIGVASMNTDFGNGASSLVAFILRNSTLESEAAPSNWTTLPSNTTNGKTWGAFLGYNMQWSQVVVGFDVGYNHASSLQSSATDSLTRIVTTSDSVQHTVTITASSSLKLVDYATFRGRAGYAFGQFLPYAILGAAVGRFNYSNTATVFDSQLSGGVTTTFGPVTDSSAKDGAITAGLVAGLGMDVALAPNVFLRGEWEYVAFGQINGIKASMNTGRVGLGVRF